MIVSREALRIVKPGVIRELRSSSQEAAMPRTEVDPGSCCTQKDVHFEKSSSSN